MYTKIYINIHRGGRVPGGRMNPAAFGTNRCNRKRRFDPPLRPPSSVPVDMSSSSIRPPPIFTNRFHGGSAKFTCEISGGWRIGDEPKSTGVELDLGAFLGLLLSLEIVF